jgi:hypothetical protein
MEYKIGEKKFKSKKEAESYTRDKIMNIGPDNNIDESRSEYPFLVDLIDNHHKKKEKIGVGIKSFIITNNKRGTGLETQIRRKDGTIESFSWKDCATHTYKTAEQLFEVAMRTSIENQIQEFRKSKQEQCNSCKEYKKCAVDHKEPIFNKLKRTFLMDKSELPMEFDKEEDTHQQKFKETDKDFEKKWQEYHKKNAVLQYLCVKCHKEKTKEDIQNNK